MKKIFKSLLDFIYPPICLHCCLPLDESHLPFCPACLSLLECINPLERCYRCFSLKHRAKHCENWPMDSAIYKMAAVFDYIGPASSLIKKFKYNDQAYLAENLSAYLVAQWAQLQWPYPDIIIPVPLSFSHWMLRRYNQSYLLAHFFGKALERPVEEILIRYSGDYSQAGLTLEQRLQLTKKNFGLKKGVDLRDKIILLIDDVMTTGKTLHLCSEVILEGYPSQIYALTVCKAI